MGGDFSAQHWGVRLVLSNNCERNCCKIRLYINRLKMDRLGTCETSIILVHFPLVSFLSGGSVQFCSVHYGLICEKTKEFQVGPK